MIECIPQNLATHIHATHNILDSNVVFVCVCREKIVFCTLVYCLLNKSATWDDKDRKDHRRDKKARLVSIERST